MQECWVWLINTIVTITRPSWLEVEKEGNSFLDIILVDLQWQQEVH